MSESDSIQNKTTEPAEIQEEKKVILERITSILKPLGKKYDTLSSGAQKLFEEGMIEVGKLEEHINAQAKSLST
jgi:hypothetical protein